MNHESNDQLPKQQRWTGEEVAGHNNDKDCWLFPSNAPDPKIGPYRHPILLNTRCDRVIIHGRVYDVTEFKEEHPGGKSSKISAPSRMRQNPTLNYHS